MLGDDPMQRYCLWMTRFGAGFLGLSLLGAGLTGCQPFSEPMGQAEPGENQGEEIGVAAVQAFGEPDQAKDEGRDGGQTQAIDGILSSDQVIIGGVSLAMDESQVRAVLGEPIAVMDEESGCCGLLRRLVYPTMTLGFVQGVTPDDMGLYSLLPTSPEVETSRGIRVGSSRHAVIEAYGPPKGEVMASLPSDDPEAPWTEDSPEYPALWYVVDYEASWLYFLLQEDEVIAIVHGSQLN